MLVNDIIRTQFFIEVEGNQSVVTHYWKVVDATILTTLGGVIEDLHGDWWTRIFTAMSAVTNTTCAVWENLMGNDPTTQRFTTIAGLSSSDPLPPKNVWRFTQHALHPPAVAKEGTLSISGFAEAFQAQGEWIAPLGDLYRDMVTEDLVMVAGPILKPMLRYVVTDVELFQQVISASENRLVKEKLGRTTGLCRVT